MKKSTLFFICIGFGGVLFGLVSFYFGLWQSPADDKQSAARQMVVSEGGPVATPSKTSAEKPVLPSNGSTLPGRPSSLAPATAVASDVDSFGYVAENPNAAATLVAGAKILSISELQSFALYWLPDGAKPERILVLLHGADSTAYDELNTALASAKEHSYGLLALQWHIKSTDASLSATDVYRGLSASLNWLDEKLEVKPKLRVLMGFNRGSTIAYEVLSIDHTRKRSFAAAVNVAGGIPLDGIVAPDVNARPDPFFVALIVGQAPSDLYSGVRFYMYCGRQDEDWGAKMCDQVSYAQTLVTKYGGKVDALVASDTLGRRGLVNDPDMRLAFVEWLLSLE